MGSEYHGCAVEVLVQVLFPLVFAVRTSFVAAGAAAVFNLAVEVEYIVYGIAPYIVGKLRVIYIRVAVALYFLYGIVAVYLLLAYRVLLVPFEQQVDSPWLQCGVGALLIVHPGIFPSQVLVAGEHIHICTCKVSLVLITRLVCIL